MNIALKVALASTGQRQVVIARRLKMHERRLSAFIYGRSVPTPTEKRRIAKLLDSSVEVLFPSEAAIAS